MAQLIRGEIPQYAESFDHLLTVAMGESLKSKMNAAKQTFSLV
jgi:hypothetical protein